MKKMKTRRLMFLYVVLCIILGTRILLYEYWMGTHSTNKEQLISKRNPVNDLSKRLQYNPTGKPQDQGKQRQIHYSEFQLLSDNLTYVYAGYYDDREEESVVKIIAVISQGVPYNFSCTVHYPDQASVEVTGYVQYHYARAMAYTSKHKFRNGYIICPVAKEKGPPTSVSLRKQSIGLHRTNVIIWPPPRENKLTRCITLYIKNYGDVSQLISNIELFRIFGVDKHIIYMDSQTQRVVDVVRSYAKDGIVEIRNLSIPQPVKLLDEFRKVVYYWWQWSAYHDCILSSMYSSKYVIIADPDEVIVPRKHKTIWELADDTFAMSEHDPTPAGALMFRNVYFPTFKNRTSKDYLEKHIALKYNIYPLLYTTRLQTNDPYITPKSLVLPKTVDDMFIHYVETFKKGWQNKVVDEHLAILHHYRASADMRYMHPPQTEDDYLLQFSSELTSAVKYRFEKAFNNSY